MSKEKDLPIDTLLSKEVKKLTPLECKDLLPSLEKELAKTEPLTLLESGHLFIKTKRATLEPLVLNRAQKHVLGVIRMCLAKMKPVRLLILKARQLGMSTLCEGIIYAYTSQIENLNTLIVADDVDGASYLFEMSKLYQEKMPSYLRPTERKSNEKKLEFDKMHSQILIDTAANTEAGRKYTFRIVHLSEYAFYKYPNELMLGLSQTVPSLAGTMILKESTANGFNHFKEEWDKAINKETDYIPIFIPWYWDDGYKMTASKDMLIADPLLGDISKDERSLESQMAADGIKDIRDHLEWRRWCIRNNCNGKLADFQQEYPSTPEEAFIASGDCAFDKDSLIAMLKKNAQPIAIGNIVKADYKYVFRPEPHGDFKVWQKIEARSSEEYLVAGDACSGSGIDWAALVAIGKKSNNVVATLRMKCDADELAEKAMLLASWLHDAEIAIENDKYGFHANRKLRTIYGNVFIQESIDKETNVVTQRFGWDTNSKTRPDMLGQLKQEIRESSTELFDPVLIREALTFVKNKETGKEEAQDGCNDDMVMARAIASAVRQMHPFQSINTTPPPRSPIADY